MFQKSDDEALEFSAVVGIRHHQDGDLHKKTKIKDFLVSVVSSVELEQSFRGSGENMIKRVVLHFFRLSVAFLYEISFLESFFFVA